MIRDMIVVCIHGEGDRAAVNAIQADKNRNTLMDHARAGRAAPPGLDAAPDMPPDVTVVLRDEHHHLRMELPLTTWDEVEEMKKLAGYDQARRHWKHGARIPVRVG